MSMSNINKESIEKVINNSFDTLENKIDVLNDTLSERINSSNIKTVYAYIAGFFDGEGYIGIDKKTLSLKLHITNTNLDILTRIKSVFKGNIKQLYEKSKSHKNTWIWTISDRVNLKFFLKIILSYSSVKRSQLLDGIAFLERTTDSRGQIGMSFEERKYREMMYFKLQEPKHRIYTQEEIYKFQQQIDNTTQLQIEFDESVYAYISGFFDAEGCIDTRETEYNLYLRVQAANTYPDTLIKIKSVFGGIVNLSTKSKCLNQRQKWYWNLNSMNSINFFLTKISSYSIVKKPQINFGFKFLKNDDYNTKLLISNELKKLKNEEYTDEQICSLYKQIEDMNIDKLQKTMMDY